MSGVGWGRAQGTAGGEGGMSGMWQRRRTPAAARGTARPEQQVRYCPSPPQQSPSRCSPAPHLVRRQCLHDVGPARPLLPLLLDAAQLALLALRQLALGRRGRVTVAAIALRSVSGAAGIRLASAFGEDQCIRVQLVRQPAARCGLQAVPCSVRLGGPSGCRPASQLETAGCTPAGRSLHALTAPGLRLPPHPGRCRRGPWT